MAWRFGTRVRRVRIERGWTQRELARRAGVSHPTVRRIENDEQDPAFSKLRRLARGLEMPLRDLVDPLPAPPTMTIAEAQTRLTQLDAHAQALKAAWLQYATTKRVRPLTELIKAKQWYGKRLKTSNWMASRRRSRQRPSEDERRREEDLEKREHWILREQQQAVLALVAAGKLFGGHPMVRQCYREARRSHDHAFLSALGGALAMAPSLSRDDRGAPLTNRDVSRLDVEQASPAGPARNLLQHRQRKEREEINAASRRSKCVPPTAIAALYTPGPWTPDRLRAAGATCSCTACRQSWPTVDDWWRAHNLALQGSVITRRPGRKSTTPSASQ